jgi:hypothetical protein
VTLGNDTTGTFNNKNAGTGKPVSTDMTISGTDASNYIIEQPTTITGNITPLGITVSAAGAKQYNATTDGKRQSLQYRCAGGRQRLRSPIHLRISAKAMSATPRHQRLGHYRRRYGWRQLHLLNTTSTSAANITAAYHQSHRHASTIGRRRQCQVVYQRCGQRCGGSDVEPVRGGHGIEQERRHVYWYVPTSISVRLALANGTGSASNYSLVGGTDTLTITPYLLTITGATAQNKDLRRHHRG